MKKIILMLVPMLFMATSMFAQIYVPADYPTIQAGLNAANAGETVLVSAGTYYENIVWPGTDGITLESVNGAINTIIDGSSSGSVIYIAAGVTNATIIDGFTIQNGFTPAGANPGAGIRDNSGITIRNNIIKNNQAGGLGGGIHCVGVDHIIFNNLIIDNIAGDSGGGIMSYGDNGLIQNNTIEGNSAYNYGGGICNTWFITTNVKDNIIVNNSAGAANGGGGIFNFYGMGTYIFSHNDVWNNTPNNYQDCTPDANSISADPVFVVSNNQYFLHQVNSPCIDAGSQTATNAGLNNYTTSYELILDGNQVDIGYHYNPSFTYNNTQWTGSAKSNDWHDAGNWDTGVIPGAYTNVVIPAGLTNYPTISASAECINISFGSNATNTATLLDNGYLTVNGTATVERYFSGNDQDWHLVSAPISDALSGVFTGMYLQSFSEATNSYTEIIQDDVPLGIMEGYGLYSNLGVTNTVSFVGALNTAPQNRGFTAGGIGWNLMGNPYVSSIDWEAVVIPTGMTNEVHYIEAATGADLSYVQGIGGAGSQYIAPHQGFFVFATAAGNLSLGDAQRTHSGAGNFYKNNNPQLLILEAANENFSDQAWIHFNENAGEEHDGQFDAYKRISLSNSELPQIFSYTPANTKLSINGMPETTMVPVGFTAVESGVFTISAVETSEFANVVLEDLFTQTQTDLLKNSCTFNYTAGDQENRFIVHFTPMAVPETFEEMVNIFSFNTDVYVTVPVNTKGNIFIYNMMGQEVASKRIDNVQNIITLEKSSYYVVKVLSDESIVTKKVFIK
jgi:hypothetical protein